MWIVEWTSIKDMAEGISAELHGVEMARMAFPTQRFCVKI